MGDDIASIASAVEGLLAVQHRLSQKHQDMALQVLQLSAQAPPPPARVEREFAWPPAPPPAAAVPLYGPDSPPPCEVAASRVVLLGGDGDGDGEAVSLYGPEAASPARRPLASVKPGWCNSFAAKDATPRGAARRHKTKLGGDLNQVAWIKSNRLRTKYVRPGKDKEPEKAAAAAQQPGRRGRMVRKEPLPPCATAQPRRSSRSASPAAADAAQGLAEAIDRLIKGSAAFEAATRPKGKVWDRMAQTHTSTSAAKVRAAVPRAAAPETDALEAVSPGDTSLVTSSPSGSSSGACAGGFYERGPISSTSSLPCAVSQPTLRLGIRPAVARSRSSPAAHVVAGLPEAASASGSETPPILAGRPDPYQRAGSWWLNTTRPTAGGCAAPLASPVHSHVSHVSFHEHVEEFFGSTDSGDAKPLHRRPARSRSAVEPALFFDRRAHVSPLRRHTATAQDAPTAHHPASSVSEAAAQPGDFAAAPAMFLPPAEPSAAPTSRYSVSRPTSDGTTEVGELSLSSAGGMSSTSTLNPITPLEVPLHRPGRRSAPAAMTPLSQDPLPAPGPRLFRAASDGSSGFIPVGGSGRSSASSPAAPPAPPPARVRDDPGDFFSGNAFYDPTRRRTAPAVCFAPIGAAVPGREGLHDLDVDGSP